MTGESGYTWDDAIQSKLDQPAGPFAFFDGFNVFFFSKIKRFSFFSLSLCERRQAIVAAIRDYSLSRVNVRTRDEHAAAVARKMKRQTLVLMEHRFSQARRLLESAIADVTYQRFRENGTIT